MITTSATAPSLDDLAETAIRLGRELEALAHDAYIGGNRHDFTFVVRTLRRLAEREPFDSRDDASLLTLRDILETELRAEIIGSERRFIETRYDNDGQHGEVRDCPIYSDRGKELLRIGEVLLRFIAARDATLDRVAAERAVNRLLQA